MFRLNTDGTVDRCDDTPDIDRSGVKYKRSAIRKGRWVCISYVAECDVGWHSRYIDDSEVPKIIKMFDLLEP